MQDRSLSVAINCIFLFKHGCVKTHNFSQDVMFFLNLLICFSSVILCLKINFFAGKFTVVSFQFKFSKFPQIWGRGVGEVKPNQKQTSAVVL